MTRAAILDQSAIWYSACNEDTASEIAALQPAGKRVLCITASGSRAFDLLLADPAEVVAIDQNPAQTALAELFAAAYRHLDYPAFCGLAGLREDPRRAETMARLLPSLSESSQVFWQRNASLVRDGLLYCGRWEGFLRRFVRWAGPKRRKLAMQLLNCPDRQAQWTLWQSQWDDWQWKLLLKAIACRPLWRWGLCEPGIAFVPHDFDMAGYAKARFDYAASQLHLRQLPFAWLLLTGAYHPDILPPYLSEAGHGLIAKRIERLTLRTASLQSTIASMELGQFEAASLSDYSSYCDTAAQREVWRDLERGMSAGGRICERKFFNKTGTGLPIASGFKRDYPVEAQLDASDGALFYSFVVAVREGA